MEDKISKLEKRILAEEKNSQQILGLFIILSAILNIVEAGIKVILRVKLAGQFDVINRYQFYLAAGKILVVVVLFIVFLRSMKKLFFHSPYVRKLLYIWGIILIPFQIIFEISIEMYNRMLGIVWLVLNNTYNVQNDAMYSMFYDSTHGFKYLGMFLVVNIGIIATGIILEKRELIVVSGILMGVFILSFLAVSMRTINIDLLSMSVGINFTSLIFNSLMTLGLFILGIYIFRTYKIKSIEL
ncbi:MAG: hypothetical protein KBS96_05450 [Lachnospiraceae bacterium]|nr:hypothetical protein [Candidatus Colinaster scatohippi]